MKAMILLAFDEKSKTGVITCRICSLAQRVQGTRLRNASREMKIPNPNPRCSQNSKWGVHRIESGCAQIRSSPKMFGSKAVNSAGST
jgi:hypothetical protein